MFWLQQVIAEENRCKDKDILQPLQRTQKSDIINHLLNFNAAKIRLSERNSKFYLSFLALGLLL